MGVFGGARVGARYGVRGGIVLEALLAHAMHELRDVAVEALLALRRLLLAVRALEVHHAASDHLPHVRQRVPAYVRPLFKSPSVS